MIYLLLDNDDTEDDLDLFGVGDDLGVAALLLRAGSATEESIIFSSISFSFFDVSTGFAPPNMDDGSATGTGFESIGTERG